MANDIKLPESRLAADAVPVEDGQPPVRRIGTGMIAGVLSFVALVCLGVDFALQPHRFPLMNIDVRGAENSEPALIQRTIAQQVPSNMLLINLKEVAESVESLPWISEAVIRRQWPDTLQVGVRERVIVARWGESSWLDDAGRQVVLPGYSDASYPTYVGPEGHGFEMLGNFRNWQPIVAGLGLEVKKLLRTDRGGWSLTLEYSAPAQADALDGADPAAETDVRGIKVVLGSVDPTANLIRFAKLYQTTFGTLGEFIVSVDMRHPDGVAVRWAGKPPAVADSIKIKTT